MRIDGVNFSRFHDLEHLPFTAYCNSQYGGWRNHLSLAWEYRCKPWLGARTSCKLGRHKWANWSRTGSDKVWRACWYCAEVRSPLS